MADVTREQRCRRLAQERGVPYEEVLRQSLIDSLVHRDIKPSNLFLTTNGLIKILDLGIAAPAFDSRLAHNQGVPAELPLCGTVDYMSPEQWDSPLFVGPKADVYALGCTFYELLEGYPPFATVRGVEDGEQPRWSGRRDP